MSRRIPREDLLKDLQRVAEELGHPPRIADYRESGNHSPETFRNRFGGWETALSEAGLDPNKRPDEGGSALQGGTHIVCYNCDNGQVFTGDSPKCVCKACGSELLVWRARVRYATTNKTMRSLAEGPKVGVDVKHHTYSSLVRKLKAPSGDDGSGENRGHTTPVYYLVGDERAAMRLFIKENEAYVRGCLSDQYNPIQKNWPDGLYELLVEQWEFHTAIDGGDGQ